MTYTTEALRNELLKLVREAYGVKQRPARWSECVKEMKMSHAAAYAFVNKYFTKNTESAVGSHHDQNIQTELEVEIENSNWLDEESKILAKDKLNSMKIFVGFPDWYKNKKAVLNYYKWLNIGAEYFDNSLSYMRYKKKVNLKSYLIQAKEDDPWDAIDPTTVNALYGHDGNMLNIPAADFQSPLFTPQLPDNINYGIAGVVVGHEMCHGFDDSGIMYGKDGNQTKFSKSMLKIYDQRANCFLDQFAEYYGETKGSETKEPTPEYKRSMRRKSMITRGENIADSTGIQTVFKAYKKLEKPEVSLKLPGLEEFTDDQLFFLSFVAIWCEVGTPEYEKKKKEEMDVHSLAKLRVIGAVSNTKGFAEVFNCPAGSPMNPTNKCNIWETSGTKLQMEMVRMEGKRNRWEGQWKR